MRIYGHSNHGLLSRIKYDLLLSCLYFYRYDPNVDIPMDVEGQNDRVIFIKSVAQFMVRYYFIFDI